MRPTDEITSPIVPADPRTSGESASVHPGERVRVFRSATSRCALRHLGTGTVCLVLALSLAGCAKGSSTAGKSSSSPAPTSSTVNPGGFGKSLGPRPEFKGQPVPVGETYVEHQDPVDSTTMRVTTTVDGQVLFDSGSASLQDTAKAVLDERAKDIPQAAAVDVIGHTDGDGDESANQVLSEERAAAVAAYLLSIRGDLKITPSGQGETNPVADNATAEGRALNRRVVISYLKTT